MTANEHIRRLLIAQDQAEQENHKLRERLHQLEHDARYWRTAAQNLMDENAQLRSRAYANDPRTDRSLPSQHG